MLTNQRYVKFQISPCQRVYAVPVDIIGDIIDRICPACLVVPCVCFLAEVFFLLCVKRAVPEYIYDFDIVHLAAGRQRVMKLLLRISCAARFCYQVNSVPANPVRDQIIRFCVGVFLFHRKEELLNSAHDSCRIDRRSAIGGLSGNISHWRAECVIIHASVGNDDVRLIPAFIDELLRNGGHIRSLGRKSGARNADVAIRQS